MKTFIVACLLFLVGCTSSHRIVAIYESGDAVSGPVKVLEKPAEVKYTRTEVKEDEKASESTEEDSGILDSLRDALP